MESWFVAKTKPTKERYVETCLSEKWGVEVFYPIIRRPSNRKPPVEPLFPTYLFCRIDTQSDAWPAIRWVPGVCYFLGADHQPVPISDEIIVDLKQRVSLWNGGGYVPRFASGERVVVTSGLFAGVEGIFQRYLPARQRCLVLLEIVGKTSKVEIPAEALCGDSRYSGLALAS
jgi:transcription antitermination factor NusG